MQIKYLAALALIAAAPLGSAQAEAIVPCGAGACGPDLVDLSQHSINVQNPTTTIATQDCSGAFGSKYTRAVVAIVPEGAREYYLYGFFSLSPMFQKDLNLEGELMKLDNRYRVYYYAEKEGERAFVQQGESGDSDIEVAFDGRQIPLSEARLFSQGAIWLRAWCLW